MFTYFLYNYHNSSVYINSRNKWPYHLPIMHICHYVRLFVVKIYWGLAGLISTCIALAIVFQFSLIWFWNFCFSFCFTEQHPTTQKSLGEKKGRKMKFNFSILLNKWYMAWNLTSDSLKQIFFFFFSFFFQHILCLW